MKSDEDVKVYLLIQMISAEVPVLFAKACELFITELTHKAWAHTENLKRRTLQRSDVTNSILDCDIFDFLIDLIPKEEYRMSTACKTRKLPGNLSNTLGQHSNYMQEIQHLSSNFPYQNMNMMILQQMNNQDLNDHNNRATNNEGGDNMKILHQNAGNNYDIKEGFKSNSNHSKPETKNSLLDFMTFQKTFENLKAKSIHRSFFFQEKSSARSHENNGKFLNQVISKDQKTLDNSHKKANSLVSNIKAKDFFSLNLKGSRLIKSNSLKEKLKKLTLAIEENKQNNGLENIHSAKSQNQNLMLKTYSTSFADGGINKIKIKKNVSPENYLERKVSSPSVFQRSPRIKEELVEGKENLNSGSTKATSESASSLNKVLVQVSKVLEHYKFKEQLWNAEREALMSQIEDLKRTKK